MQANSWPLLQFVTGNANDSGQPGPIVGRPPLSLDVTTSMVMRAGDSNLIVGMKREGQEALWDTFNTLRFECTFARATAPCSMNVGCPISRRSRRNLWRAAR